MPDSKNAPAVVVDSTLIFIVIQGVGFWLNPLTQNKFTAKVYSKDQAQAMDLTLLNCRGCTDCWSCQECYQCTSCHNCRGCEMVAECGNCDGCKVSTRLHGCQSVSNSDLCQNVRKAKGLNAIFYPVLKNYTNTNAAQDLTPEQTTLDFLVAGGVIEEEGDSWGAFDQPKVRHQSRRSSQTAE